jgi:hypothetical protein
VKPRAGRCEHCDHKHLGAEVCHNSKNRQHLCGCRGTKETGTINLCEGEGAMAKDVEVVEGSDPKAKALEALGFRVSRVTVKETEDGGKSGDATVIGIGFTQGAALVGAIGEGVELASNGGDRRQKATLRSITFKAGKDGKPGSTTLKVTGAAELDDAIGSVVKVKPLQMSLLK